MFFHTSSLRPPLTVGRGRKRMGHPILMGNHILSVKFPHSIYIRPLILISRDGPVLPNSRHVWNCTRKKIGLPNLIFTVANYLLTFCICFCFFPKSQRVAYFIGKPWCINGNGLHWILLFAMKNQRFIFILLSTGGEAKQRTRGLFEVGKGGEERGKQIKSAYKSRA